MVSVAVPVTGAVVVRVLVIVTTGGGVFVVVGGSAVVEAEVVIVGGGFGLIVDVIIPEMSSSLETIRIELCEKIPTFTVTMEHTFKSRTCWAIANPEQVLSKYTFVIY